MSPVVLVTGAGGQLGAEVLAELERRSAAMVRGPGLEVVGADRAHLDVSDRDAVLAAVTELEPDIVVHAAAWTAVDACEDDPDRAYAVNALGTRHVAEAARIVGAHVAYVSTDYVFDGRSDRPYCEWDPPGPLSVYGASKLGGERELSPGATIVRTSWVCGRTGSNIVRTLLGLVASGAPLRFVDDQRGSPTVAGDLAEVLVELALTRRPGTFHVTNSGAASWYELARAVVAACGADPDRVEPVATADLRPPRRAPRPASSVLDNMALRLSGFEALRPWQEAVEELVGELTR